MKKIGYILIAAVVLVACSGDPEQWDDKGAPLHLMDVTRAPSGIAISDANEVQAPIQIFMTTGTKIYEGQFIYTPGVSPASGTWTSTIGVKDEENYIYGFSPATAAAGFIEPLTGGATDYSGGAKIKLSNLSAVTGDDVCVVVGVKKVGANEIVTPNFGVFKYMRTDDNYICLLLDHIYAGLDVKCKIGEEYHKLRDIRLKKVELQAKKTVKDVTITLTASPTDDDANPNPISSINYNYETTSNQQSAIYDYETDTNPDNSTGIILTESGVTILGCFAPDVDIANHLVLKCTYDVYYKGTCVRENCTATNNLSVINEATVERGKKSTIVLTVEPTYLYQLSEDELNNPTITISN